MLRLPKSRNRTVQKVADPTTDIDLLLQIGMDLKQPGVKVYGADWCPKTVDTLEFLRENRIPHEYINVERDAQASEWVKSQNHGKELKPTVDIGGKVLAEPSNAQLREALKDVGVGV